jgi:uncharacterized membrane protein YdjX (TVP38/TMEM64 family)
MTSLEHASAGARRGGSWQTSVRVFAGAATALVMVALVLFLVHRGQVETLLAWVDGFGWAAAPLFVLLYSIEVVVLLPGIVFPLAAGFFFGWGEGTLLSMLGKLLGSVSAFLLARRVLAGGGVSARARARLQRSKRWKLLVSVLLTDALPRGGWRTVALVRLVPLVPFKLSNYLFGWSEVRLRDFVIGTLLGTIPFSLANAYLGSAAAGRGLGVFGVARSAGPASAARWWISGAVAVVASVAAVVVARHALRVLRAASTEPLAPDGQLPLPGTERGAPPEGGA